MYVYCVVCYHVIVAPYVRSVVLSLHIVTLLMMIRKALWTMRLLYSLMFFLTLLVCDPCCPIRTRVLVDAASTWSDFLLHTCHACIDTG